MAWAALPTRAQVAAFLSENKWELRQGEELPDPVPPFWDLRGRARRMREHCTLQEFSGALGDIGTLVPILISLTLQGSASLTTSLFFGGLWNVLTGFFYGIPMCVQPMKSIAAIALANKFTPGELAGAGVGVSAIVMFLGVSRLIWLVTRLVPLPVVKGLQLGTCFQLCKKGVGLVKRNPVFWGHGVIWSDNLWWACASFLLVLFVYEQRRVPVAMVIFAAGVAFALAQTGTHGEFEQVHPGAHFVHTVVPTAAEFRTGFLSAGLGQLPLTLLNSVVALAALARELFPGHRPSMAHISVTIGVMNLGGCFFGAMPFCHGSGGLAGQYFFGARTELSLYFLGAAKMIVGVVFGESLLVVLAWFPSSFLGVMLFMAAVELGLVARNFTLHPHDERRRRQDFAVTVVTASALVGFSHDGLGFLVGMVTALAFWGHWKASALAATFSSNSGFSGTAWGAAHPPMHLGNGMGFGLGFGQSPVMLGPVPPLDLMPPFGSALPHSLALASDAAAGRRQKRKASSEDESMDSSSPPPEPTGRKIRSLDPRLPGPDAEDPVAAVINSSPMGRRYVSGRKRTRMTAAAAPNEVSLDKLLEPLEEKDLRQLLDTLVAQNPHLAAQVRQLVPKPTVNSACSQLVRLERRLQAAFPYNKSGPASDDYTYHRVRPALEELRDTIVMYLDHFTHYGLQPHAPAPGAGPATAAGNALSHPAEWFDLLTRATDVAARMPRWDRPEHNAVRRETLRQLADGWLRAITAAARWTEGGHIVGRDMLVRWAQQLDGFYSGAGEPALFEPAVQVFRRSFGEHCSRAAAGGSNNSSSSNSSSRVLPGTAA
ncbi:hypothetical protein LPJ61_003875 [Coemansia biformis]|uniref:Tethering factor for nuclear proteasome STS1 n=1 Tax=Coemansia biformis TaxID=1286918 RepID=A0A9W7YD12_9FUNG|nr:hypothetical protein LPJ61_003875 [Coemansia biformis]